MNSQIALALQIIGGLGILYWLWKRLLRGASLTILLFSMILVVVLNIEIPAGGLGFIVISAVTGGAIEIVRIATLEAYTEAEATFETDQTMRGLSPVEAGWSIGLPENEVITIAILALLDKGVLNYDQVGQRLQIEKRFIPKNEDILTVEARSTYRVKAAYSIKQILHGYEQALLELIPENGGIQLGELDADIWNKYFHKSLHGSAAMYDLPKTKVYARRVLEHITFPEGGFAEGKQNLSGWYATRIFDDELIYEKNHRPTWLEPGDDFESFVFQISDRLIS